MKQASIGSESAEDERGAAKRQEMRSMTAESGVFPKGTRSILKTEQQEVMQ